LFGIAPGRELDGRLDGVPGDNERVGSPSQIKPVKLSGVRARPPHRSQIVVNDVFAGGDRLICAGKVRLLQ
jgi:hypothetical protein